MLGHRRTARRTTRLCAAVVAVPSAAALALALALPAQAAPLHDAESAAASSTADPAGSASNAEIDPQAVAAYAKDKRITLAEAERRLSVQQQLGERGRRVEQSLEGRTGGSYLAADGSLVVTTLDPAGDAVARKAGAGVKRVDDTAAELEAVVKRLDQAAKQGGPGAVHGWYVDVPGNTVVVTVSAGAKDARTAAITKVAKSFGSSVRVEERPAAESPRTTAYLVGGFEINPPAGGPCSHGFNAKDASNRNVVVTAGHCVKTSGTVSRNGYWIGGTRTANFPVDDYGTFWNSYPSYWTPSVSVSKYNGTFVNVRGQWNAPPVGATVCKSGRTTGYTCGAITALNQTVFYPQGAVYGLVRHNACVQGGDSGGSNISAGAYALGVTSGASLTTSGLCLSKVGQQNVSWYQPIGEALSANGLRLVYQP